MAVTINASLSAGLVQTADTSGIINLQSGGTTVATISSTGVAVTGTLSASGAVTGITDLTTTGNTILGNASTDTLNVGNGDLIKDASGNLGLGVTPSAWSGSTALEMASGSFSAYSTTEINANQNCFNNGAGWRYKTTAAATQFRQTNGVFSWYNAPSGTAGNAITFTTAMTLDASGRLGIGNTSPSAALSFEDSAGTAGDPSKICLFAATGTPLYGFGVSASQLDYVTGGAHVFYSRSGTTSTERARIDSSGNLLVGTTTATGTCKVILSNDSGTTKWQVGPATSSGAVQFYITAGAGVYLASTSATSWTANSDINLKTITGKIENALDSISTLTPARYTWKNDETNAPQVGLIAQEIQNILPEVIDVNIDGYLGVRYTEVIPLLVAAIQEQQALITSLTARLDTQAEQIKALQGAK